MCCLIAAIAKNKKLKKKLLYYDVTIQKDGPNPEKRLQPEYLNKDGALSSILMFVAADSADTCKSGLWKHSRGPRQWARVLHYSVIPPKLRTEKQNFGCLCCRLSCSFLPTVTTNQSNVSGGGQRLKPGWTLKGRANFIRI